MKHPANAILGRGVSRSGATLGTSCALVVEYDETNEMRGSERTTEENERGRDDRYHHDGEDKNC
jgi:hypothetical protein